MKNIKSYNDFVNEGFFDFLKKDVVPEKQYNIEEEEEEEEFEEEPDKNGMVKCDRCHGRGRIPGTPMWVVVPMPVSDDICPKCHGTGRMKKSDEEYEEDEPEY